MVAPAEVADTSRPPLFRRRTHVPSDRAALLDQIRSLLQKGAPWEAADVYRAAAAAFEADPELRYWGALAHARSGSMRIARALIEEVRKAHGVADDIRRECLSLSGRLWKDRIDRRSGDEPVGDEAAERARLDYLEAYAIDRHPYPGVNVATLSMVCGLPLASVRSLAADVEAALSGRQAPLNSWDEASRGEALLLLGAVDEAKRSYRRAAALAPDDRGSIASMRRQLALLQRVLPDAADVIAVLPAAAVIAFSGHMLDGPGRATPRFPASLAPTVAAALRDRLAGLHKPLVYTSAACGADILFIEAALSIDAEVTIVLPFDRDDFVVTSVAPAGPGWVERFERVLARVSRVVAATDERFLDDEVLFEHAQHLVNGLAILRASQLQTTPTMLCLLDASVSALVGGTQAAADHWSRRIGPVDVIDLGVLRQQARDAAVGPQEPAATAPVSHPAVMPTIDPVPRSRPRRTLKVALFADVAGFGRLHDAQAPLFHAQFLGLVSAQIAASVRRPLSTNTWGDAIYAAFDSAEDGAAFALGLIERMQAIDWVEAGLSSTSHIRVALNAGPVFCGFDPIIERDNYFGSSVTKAARIEPVTPPGVVYASEAFVATLASHGTTAYHVEYAGELDLAKGYRASRIYRVEHR